MGAALERDPTLPPDHPALQLVTDYYDVLRKDGLKPGDRERLIRLIGDDRANSVFAFLRSSTGAAPILVVCNMTP